MARFAFLSPIMLVAVLLAGCGSVPARGASVPAAARPSLTEAMELVERSAELALWPGFDPRAHPVAIFDGERTLLFRHADPPPEFAALPEMPDVQFYPGRHPLVQANTSVRLNGVPTATVLLASEGAPTTPAALAALVVHETFHAFREARHPDWAGNEAELFVYPVEDPDLLRLRRLETEALRRALAAADRERSACWARAALDLRGERYAALAPGAVAYERGSELNEGLATYLEHRVAGDGGARVIPPGDYAVDAVRERSYATGHALALLLDRLAPNWKQELESGRSASLDGHLRASLKSASPSRCGFTDPEVRLARQRAERDVVDYRNSQAEQRGRFAAAPGWRVEVLSTGEPLWPQGFDPLNVRRVSAGEVLHTRWLRLGNSAGAIEVLGRGSLTEAAGQHPLFNGVRRLVVTGLETEPVVRDSAGVVILSAEGVTARFKGSAGIQERAVTLRVGGGEAISAPAAAPLTGEGSATARR